MIKLKNILLEDSRKVRKGAEDLYAWMKNPLSAQGADPTAKLSGSAKFLVNKGEEDGDSSDDSTITPGGLQDISVDKIQASQNEVGKEQSLANVMTGVDGMAFDGIDYGDVNWLIDAMKPGAKITFKDALLGAKTEDGMVVLDGHHRWSQAFMINPTAQVNVEVAKSNLSADDTLQAVHLAILAKTGASKTKGAKGGNLFAAGESDVEGYLNAPKRKVDPKTGEDSDTGIAPYIYAVMKTKNITDPVEGKKAAIAYAMDAIKKCAATVVPGAPSRDSMPQADGKLNAIDAAGAFASLGSGEVNFSPPYRKESIQNKKSILTKNTMKQKLKISIAEQKETLKMKRTARIISESEYQKRIRLIEDAEADKIDATLYPNKLSKVNADTAKKLTNNETPGDEDKAKGSVADVPAESLKASQTTMDFGKFVGMSIQMMAKIGTFSSGAGGDLGAIISNDNHIMDGHHRWAATLMIDPKAKVGGIFINLPGENLVGVLNVWTVANGGKGKPSDTSLSSLTGDAVAEKFKEMCNKGGGFLPAPEEILKKFKENGFDSLEAATEHVKKNWESTPSTRKVLGWMPAKIDMPAIEPDQLAKVKSDIENGKLDLNAPYQTKAKAESKNHIIRDLESVLQESIATWKKHRRK